MFLNPEYAPRDRALFGGILRPLLLLFLLLSAASFIILLIVGIQVGAVIEGINSIIFLAAYGLYKRNKVNSAAYILIYTMLASFLLSLVTGRDTYYVAAFLFPIILLLGSIYLSRRAFVITFTLSVLLFASASFESFNLHMRVPGYNYSYINPFVAVVLIIVSIVTINLFTNMLYKVFRTASLNEEKFRVISEKIKVGIYAFSSQGKFVYVNEFLCRLLGYTETELLTMDYLNLVHPEDRGIVQERGRRRLAGDDVINGYEVRVVRKDGTLLWVFLSASKVDISEKKLGIGALFDIQQKKNLEGEVLQEKEQLSITLRSIDEGVLVTDLGGIVTLINRAAGSLTGVDREEGIGRHVNSFFTSVEIEGRKEKGFFSLLEDCTRHSRAVEGFFGVAGSSNRRFLSVSPAFLENERSEKKGYVIVFKDITEAKKAEESAGRIEKLEALGLFAGGIAHDFNNILTGIMGNIDLLRLYLKDTGDTRVAARLKDAEEASSRAAGLTRQLLTFSRGGSPVKDVTSLPQLVEDTVSFVLSGSNITHHVAYPDTLWNVEADQSQISQVIQNLTMNSKQAMEGGGGEVSVSLDNFFLSSEETVSGLALSKGRYVRIIFKDNGPGIPPEVQAKIFDPYFTTKETGNGLGLATAYSIIKQHGGYIGVDSEINGGTTFTLYLAAARGGTAAEDSRKGILPEGRQPVSGKKTILILDDEAVVRSVTAEMLLLLGYESVQTAAGAACIEEYTKRVTEENPFDAVIMDLTIPGGMGGKEAAAEILKIDPSARLIAASGYSNDTVLANYTEYGFSAVLRKPFRLEELEHCLHNLV